MAYLRNLYGRTGYIFVINPNGARYDGLIENEGEGENDQWDGIWSLLNNREDPGDNRAAFGFAKDYPNDLWDISINFKRIGEDYDPSMDFVSWKGIYKANSLREMWIFSW